MSGSRKPGLRCLCLLVCALCLLSLVQPTAAEPASLTTEQTLTTVVRLSANKNAASMGQLENGTKVTVLGQRGDFYKIDCYDMNGYVAKTQIVHTEDGEYYVNCSPESSETKNLNYTEHGEALELRHSLLSLAKKQLGYPYVYGGTRPGGFDCSGLMLYLYGQHGISLHRTAAQQLRDGIIIPREALQVGDLIFFYEPGRTYPASHVSIYAGNNQIIHAGSKGIEYADLDLDYYVDYYLCARRIINTNARVELAGATPVDPVSRSLSGGGISGRTAG